MTAFIESCVQTTAGSAQKAQRSTRGRPHARKLLRMLEGKKNVLVTTHVHPDPPQSGNQRTALLSEPFTVVERPVPVDERTVHGFS